MKDKRAAAISAVMCREREYRMGLPHRTIAWQMNYGDTARETRL